MRQILLLVTVAACVAQHPDPHPAPPPRVANLHAFARLYGVVRWFHPSDAAAATDWDAFAVAGARSVIDAPDATVLRDRLVRLFAPMAPTVRIALASEPLVDAPELNPASTVGLDVVAWEHRGYGESALASAYQSKRRHRRATVDAEGLPFGSLVQTVDATPYRGATIRLRGKLRAAPRASAHLWVRIDRANGTGFFDNMSDRPVRSTDWTDAEIIGTVDADAVTIAFGPLASGSPGAWFDELALEVRTGDGWQPIPIADAGFEADDPMAAWRAGIGKRGYDLTGWAVKTDRDHPAAGAASLQMSRKTTTLTDELFDDAPAPGETVDIDLGRGLRARVPIALYSREGRTIGDDPELARQHQSTAPASTVFDPIVGVADVIVVWNVLQHFWPYWDVVRVDWNAELDIALARALDDVTVDDHIRTLQRLSAAAPDGHASVACAGAAPRASLPFELEEIEHQLVVTSSADTQIERGDVLVSVDGRVAADLLFDATSKLSGSPQWRQTKAMSHLGDGRAGSIATVRLRRDASEREVRVTRVISVSEPDGRLPPIKQLESGIWYVDLDRAAMPEIDAVMDKLAAAPGIVFDMRGYPNSTHPVLSHLLTRADTSKWMEIAHVIRPDHVAPPAWDRLGWQLPVLEPHLRGRVAFLTGPGAISYAESVMGFVEGEHLGAIIGAATAGTNGNVAQIDEPSGCLTIFTGMRVIKHDGSQHHLIGVLPTLPAARTVAGVRAGRDEVLEAALAWLTRL
jgi:hypothetical protein